ncbi:MAG: PEGA domain-containing protein [Polyangiaceae bacterium]|nr:PEGA domain-containing protein [Polyangiaceae bacterium]
MRRRSSSALASPPAAVALAAFAAFAALAPPSAAQEAKPAAAAGAPEGEGAKAEARGLYVKGVDLVQKAQWAEALSAFEASAKLYPHPTTTFNIGACERALGRYARARGTLSRALAENEAGGGGQMPEALASDARAFIGEIDRLLAHVTVTLEPGDAAISVDGRPLEVLSASGGRPSLVAGTLGPGPGARPPAATFDLTLDPGAHVVTLDRKGYTQQVVNRTFAPGSTSSLRLELEKLPATLRVTSSEAGALVRVDDVDVGPAPVDVLRPAGSYRVVVGKAGFVAYEAQVAVKAGEEAKLRATLVPEKTSIAEKWWFWTGAAAVLAGGVALTFALTRPEPEPPPFDGGNTGWVVVPQRFGR